MADRPAKFRSIFMFPGMALCMTMAAGCAQTMLNVEDVIACPGQTVELHAYLENRSFLFTTGRLADIEVAFERDGEILGVGHTDHHGRASINCPAGTETWDFTARAGTARWQGASQGHVFVWPESRPLVAIDIDETVIRSQYLSLLFDRHDQSPPMPHSQRVIKRLAQQYGVIYISARARLFRDKTRQWLSRYDYPVGPVILGADFNSIAWQHDAKYRMLKALREQRPALRIGIGDKGADENAFLANRMKCIIINPLYLLRDHKTIVMDDWRGVEKLLLDREPASQSNDRISLAASSRPAHYEE